MTDERRREQDGKVSSRPPRGIAVPLYFAVIHDRLVLLRLLLLLLLLLAAAAAAAAAAVEHTACLSAIHVVCTAEEVIFVFLPYELQHHVMSIQHYFYVKWL